MMTVFQHRLRDGILWSAFERFAVQGLQFFIFVLMARALTPTDYGLVGMLTFFIVIAQLVAEGGLSQAIIRKLDRDEKDLSTSFFVNISVGGVLYLILYLSSSMIAQFYEEPALLNMLRVMGLCVIIQSSLVVHRALLTSRLDFKSQAKSTLVGALASGLCGISMAYKGYGAWAIVGLQLTNQIATGISLWLVSDWHPKWQFSASSFKNLYGFGYKLLLSNVIESIYNSFLVLSIGKVFSAYALGSYTNAKQLGSVSSENLTRIVQRAAFPKFCTLQNDTRKLRQSISDYLRIMIFIIAPLMLGLAALSQPLTTALIGPQWLYTGRLLRILCVCFLFFPLTSVNFMVLEILGKGVSYLRLQIIKVAVGLSLLALLLPYGLSAVCVGLVITATISYVVSASLAGQSICFGFIPQIKTIFPIIINALIAASIMFALQFTIEGEWLQVTIGILAGLLTYGALSLTFQTELCNMLVSLLRLRKMD